MSFRVRDDWWCQCQGFTLLHQLLFHKVWFQPLSPLCLLFFLSTRFHKVWFHFHWFNFHPFVFGVLPQHSLTWHRLPDNCSVAVMCVQIKFTVIQNTSTSALLWISQLCIARPGFQEMSCLPSSVVASLSLPLPPNVLPPTHHASKSETEHKVPTVFTKTFHIKSYRVVILTNISAEVYKYCQKYHRKRSSSSLD